MIIQAIAVRCIGLALAALVVAVPAFAQLAAPPRETIIPVPNGGFENGEEGWEFVDGRETCRVTDAQAAGSKQSLLISRQPGFLVKIQSAAIACKGPALVQLRGKFLSKWGYYLYLHLQQFDAAGNELPESAGARLGTFGADAIWQSLEGWRDAGPVWLHPETASLRILLEGKPHPEHALEVYFDDLQIVNFGLPIPPWPGQYKLKPGDKDKLTAADVVGPDGIAYPNWTQVGVQGGIPDVPVKVKLDDLGARPQTDISDLLTSAVAQVGAQGGGAILIGKGTFYLGVPVIIRQSGVVIRGSGRDATRLVFHYSFAHPGAKFPGGWPVPSVFAFRGKMEKDDQKRLLIADGKRGDTTLEVKEIADLKAGDKFIVRAPSTPRWESLTRHKETVGWGIRINAYEAQAIRGDSIAIGQPLRIDFPVVDGAYIRKIMPVERCGIEDMTVEHACRMPFDTLNSHWAWNCWARCVSVVKCGRSGVHFREAKWCEVRDCDFDGFDPAVHRAHENWWAYGGFTCAWDCLMENTACHRFRHAPQVQFGAQGNVIRNSTFEGSDAQWHAGWSTENLFENCTIGPSGPYGSYGYGMYSTPSHDTTHGPNGPRNVVYNCDVKSDRDGVCAWGLSEGWLFLHNRFNVAAGCGFLASEGFFDAIVRGNVFILKNTQSPMVLLQTPDCVGIDLIGNTLVGGSGNIADGAVKPAVDKDNRTLPAWKWDEPLPNRPKADPPSIYEWQLNSTKSRY
jgi:hypothetical protein